MICAIVAFATIVDYDDFSSKIRYTVGWLGSLGQACACGTCPGAALGD